MSDSERIQLTAPTALEPPIVGRIWTQVEANSVLAKMASQDSFGTCRAAILAGFGADHGANVVSHGPTVHGIEVLNLFATPAALVSPFSPDPQMEKPNLLLGTLRETVLDAMPFTLRLRVFHYTDGSLVPAERAYVELWQADAAGVRSGMASGADQKENTCGQSWLRGHQWTDEAGKVAFRTVFPGASATRAPHFSIRVVTGGSPEGQRFELKADLFVDDYESDLVFAYPPYRSGRRVNNADDPVFSALRTDGSKVGGTLLVHLDGSTASGYTGDFNLALALV